MTIKPLPNNEKKYYKLLDSIKFENGYDINGCGFVALSVPFKWAPNAIKFAMLKLPEITPHDNPVFQNKEYCCSLSVTILPEIERLMMCLEQMIDESRGKLHSLVRQRDEKPNDLLGNVERNVLQEYVLQQIGYNSALYDVLKMLSDRKIELGECSFMKPSD